MNYNHAYHAGSFADVMKHIILVGLLKALQRKNTPYCYLDTHAAFGCYDLRQMESGVAKTSESANGIRKLFEIVNPPQLVQDYLAIIQALNPQHLPLVEGFHRYPGSPLIARKLLRPQDRMVLCELNKQVIPTLKNVFAADKQVAIHHQDGYLGAKAFLPPKEKRGIVLIDPAYEKAQEFDFLAGFLPQLHQRWNNGILALWCPIKTGGSVQKLYKEIQKQLKTCSIVALELSIFNHLPDHLNGCSMIIINPPWQLPESMLKIMAWLWKGLSINGQGGYDLRWLNSR